MNKEKAIQQVINFHEKIEQWFNGNSSIDKTQTDWLMTDFHPDFKMSPPDGSCLTYDDLEKWLPLSYGNDISRKVRVEILTSMATDFHAVVSYYETQLMEHKTTKRYSSAVFIKEGDQMKWLSLIENWVDE